MTEPTTDPLGTLLGRVRPDAAGAHPDLADVHRRGRRMQRARTRRSALGVIAAAAAVVVVVTATSVLGGGDRASGPERSPRPGMLHPQDLGDGWQVGQLPDDVGDEAAAIQPGCENAARSGTALTRFGNGAYQVLRSRDGWWALDETVVRLTPIAAAALSRQLGSATGCDRLVGGGTVLAANGTAVLSASVQGDTGPVDADAWALVGTTWVHLAARPGDEVRSMPEEPAWLLRALATAVQRATGASMTDDLPGLTPAAAQVAHRPDAQPRPAGAPVEPLRHTVIAPGPSQVSIPIEPGGVTSWSLTVADLGVLGAVRPTGFLLEDRVTTALPLPGVDRQAVAPETVSGLGRKVHYTGIVDGQAYTVTEQVLPLDAAQAADLRPRFAALLMASGEFRSPTGERLRFAWSNDVAFSVSPAADDPAAPTAVHGYLLRGRTLIGLDVVRTGSATTGVPTVTVAEAATLLLTAALLAD